MVAFFNMLLTKHQTDQQIKTKYHYYLGNNRPDIELQKTRTTPVQTQKATQKVTPTQGQKGPISQNKGSSGKKENTQALSNSG